MENRKRLEKIVDAGVAIVLMLGGCWVVWRMLMLGGERIPL